MNNITHVIGVYEARLAVLQSELALAERDHDVSRAVSLNFRIGYLAEEIRFMRALEGVK